MEVIKNLWNNLDDLLENDPERYKALMEECGKRQKEAASLPQPFACIRVVEITVS